MQQHAADVSPFFKTRAETQLNRFIVAPDAAVWCVVFHAENPDVGCRESMAVQVATASADTRSMLSAVLL